MQSFRNHFQHTVHVAHDVIVPEPQNSIVMVVEPLSARLITDVFRMLSAIHFDDQTLLAANEINNVSADWLLSDEFGAID